MTTLNTAKGNKFKSIKPRVVTLQTTQLVKSELLFADKTLPLVMQPDNQQIDLVAWAKENTGMIEEQLLKHGAILFRNFRVASPQVFEQFAGTLSPDLYSENGEHPREEISGNVYTPVFYPPEKKLLWHNENSFNATWPVKIWFYCGKPADQGGETPIVDSRTVYEQIDPAIRAEFERKNVMYVRNYGTGLGLNWQTVFRTKDKQEVEAYCRHEAIEFEWKDNDRLKTYQLRPAVLTHPKTGEKVWWNQATHWHPACLDPDVRASLFELFSAEDLPRTCFFGDGTPIEDAAMTHVCEVFERNELSFPWQQGDIMMLDNMLAAHARNPFQGARKLYVAMGGMMSLKDLEGFLS
jgi:alpha-ketoglutarate-dependent taurine dioxygenase